MTEENQGEPADIETASDGYARRFGGPIGTWMLEKQSDIVLDLLASHKDDAVLDVGGGHAQLARPLVEAGCSVTVHGSAAECSARIQDLVVRDVCRFVCAPMLQLPFEDGSVDTVLCFRLLTHCDEWPALIGELCRVTRRAVIIDYPTSQSLNAFSGGLFSAKKRLEGNTRTWRLFSREELTEAFEKHGFTCQAERKQFFLPMVLHRTLRCPPLSTLLEGICRCLGLTRLWGSPVIAEWHRQTCP
ncbi:MAG: class I SAM-dependent methyltransferase [Kiritimatiellia bacterium]|jgi:SAM-dependent methyltransferase|nr:class I SAM-dependent methyltransferase [Kiritimatiellia bacterium]MDP6811428.1 class I SAM-dependent methyltransferase [Kiritimatiellia bacterium]